MRRFMLALTSLLFLTACGPPPSGTPRPLISIFTATLPPSSTEVDTPSPTSIPVTQTPRSTLIQPVTPTATPAPTSAPTPTAQITTTAQPTKMATAIATSTRKPATAVPSTKAAATSTSLPAPTKPPQPTAAPTSAPAAVDTSAAWYPCQQGQIKGNLNSGIYHVPSGASYATTRANVQCFNTEAEAIAAGFRKAKR